MKSIGHLLLVACVAVMLSACGDSNNSSGDNKGGDGDDSVATSTPETALSALNKAFKSGDADNIIAAYWTDAEQEKKLRKEVGEMKELWDAGGSFEVEFSKDDIKVTGDTAEARVTLKIKMSADTEAETEKETYLLEKRDGVWKCTPR